jgi:3-isopropylmalate/(R)-2-methylmalate dehydratase small subunit
LLAAVVSQSDIDLIWKALEAHPGTEVTVDLVERVVRVDDFTAPFEVDEYVRWRLMEGLDDISLTLRHADAITDFETRRPSFKPTTTPLAPTA